MLDSDAQFEKRRLKRRLALWRLGAIIAIVVAGVVIAGGSFHYSGDAGVLGRPYVARVVIDETIFEDPLRREAIEDLADNDNVRAVLLYINSPGGSTYGSEELFVSLRHVGENKPIAAVIGTIGASGGYMTALAADRIFAGESSIVGSIGVLFQTVEVSKLLDKVGVSAETITSGPLKAEPSPFKPLSNNVRQATQAMINQTSEWFIGLVHERRHLNSDQIARISDGRVFIGRIGLGIGLIDQLGGEREARAWLESEHKISRTLPVRTVRWRGPAEDWRDFFSEKAQLWFRKVFLSERLSLDGLTSLWHAEPQ